MKDSFKLLERKNYQRRGRGFIVQLDGPGDDSSSEESEESSESEPEEEVPVRMLIHCCFKVCSHSPN